MPSWNGRSRGSALGYRIFVWLLRTGGLKPAYALLHLVTPYYRLFARDAVRPLRQLYEDRLGYSSKEASGLIKSNLITFGQVLIDKIAVLSGMENAFDHVNIGDTSVLSEMLQLGNGGLIVSAHLGNWEVAGHLLKKMDTPVYIVMYDGEAENLKKYMERFDSKRSFNIIYIREDLSHIYEISAALRRNELVCLHGDRFRPGNRTMEHEFLGEKALFPAGPFILASKLKVPVCFVFGIKEGKFLYHYQATTARTYTGKGREGMEQMLDDYVRVLEEKIKQYPEQWFNYYDFWKHE